MDKKVFLCVNSDIGRGNTIGARFGHVMSELRQQKIDYTVVARANYSKERVITPWYKNYFGRFLNALHIYIFTELDVRRWELFLFDRFVCRVLKKDVAHYATAHIGEYLPKTCALLKSRGTRVLLDMPIAHPAETEFLLSQGVQAASPGEREPVDYINKTISLVDALLAPSDFVVKSVQRAKLSPRFVIIPFGVSLPKLSPHTPDPQAVKVFLFAGNINYRKGVAYLLEAWQRSGLSARTDVKLILCGRVYAQIKSVIAQYSFKNVAYTGFTAVAPLYAQASVFVLPSLIEGSAKAVYEAMSYGLPCIVTPNTGSIIKNGEDGIVVPSADSSTLGNAMKLLADSADARERLGREARHIVANYSWEHYAKKVVQSYEL